MTAKTRAVSKDLEGRENQVVEILAQRNASAPELATELLLTYPQMLLILGRLESKGVIERIPGRLDRKILYTLTGPYSKVEAFVIPEVGLEKSDVRTLLLHDDVYVSLEDILHFMQTYSHPDQAYDELRAATKESLPVDLHGKYLL